jgi:uncharacterized iron-regulated membrane protein
MRPVLVFFHRYVGLAMAGFLAIAGLTGAPLAFFEEIDGWLNPAFYNAPAQGEPLDLATLVDRTAQELPGQAVVYVETHGEVGHPALVVTTPSDPTAHDWHYLDPVSGKALASRRWSEHALTAESVMPFLYEFHHDLTLPGTIGVTLMGVIAILWVIDCLIAPFLTFPGGRPFWGKWKQAWAFKRRPAPYRFALDLHRAGSLWLWALLLPVAVSSVAMNLPEQVFRPMVNLVSPVEPHVWYERGDLTPEALGTPKLTTAEIIPIAQQAAQTLGVTEPATAVFFSPERNYFSVGFGDEHGSPLGAAWLYFEGTTGTLIRQTLPGQGTAGEIFIQLQEPIHGGRIGGLAGRIIIALLGLFVCAASLTGVLIWWKKLQARRATKKRRATN